MRKATQKVANAQTVVFWDIVRCPVPLGCDPRLVAPCIKRYLKSLGYTGPLTIIAIGVLTDVPNDILEAVASTGIILNHTSNSFVSIKQGMWKWTLINPPPANILMITLGVTYSLPFPLYKDYFYGQKGFQWENFLQGAPQEHECSETASWECLVCIHCTPGRYAQGLCGEGFQCFTEHLSSPEHARKLLGFSPNCDPVENATHQCEPKASFNI